jgi:hypothetical protein
MLGIITGTCPATTSTMPCPDPLYGTWTILNPAIERNSSTERCGLVPTPAEA